MDFFKDKAYKRFFDELEKKYKRTGKITGFINIEKITEVEVRAFEEIGQYFHREIGNDIKIKVSKLNSYFENTNLPINSCEELLFWHKGDIETSKEKKSIKEKDEESFINSILDNIEESVGKEFVKEFVSDNRYRKLFVNRYNTNNSLLKKDLIYLAKTLNILPNNISMTVLSNEITGDPHYFDEKNSFFVILFEGIKYILKVEDEMSSLSDKYEVLNRVGLYKEDILNNIAVYNFEGVTSKGGKSLLLEASREEKSYIILSIGQINKLKELSSKSKNIFMLENPSTFHSSVTEFNDSSFICTSGNLNFSAYVFLDKLKLKDNQKVYYIGDIDPEGLVIADKIVGKYSFVELLGADKKTYNNYISNKEVSEISLKKLDKLKNIAMDLVEELKIKKKASYQESYTEKLIKEIIER